MCGIVGILQSPGAPPPKPGCLDAMTDALAHRGPDDRGTWSDRSAGVHLGHRRLAIIDLSAHGHQPKTSSDGRFTVTYNGEIYNYRELRNKLEAQGRSFVGASDTEVLLEAVGAWGIEETLRRLVGMFAFALWDGAEGRLHLARDRFGEKPLHYAWLGQSLVFASELKAITQHPDFTPRLDRTALTEYVRLGYVPAPRTIYEGVQKLPPGMLLTVDAKTGTRPAPRTYWSAADVAQAGVKDPFPTEKAALDALDAVLRTAIQRSTVADVPVGVFLSGGIDSSAVAALLQAQSDRPVHTFTIGFDEEAFDEAPHARRIAQHLGTQHTEFRVTPEQARAVIPLLPAMHDEPFADSSQIPTFLVSKLARSRVTVALSGDGGDELFGGYNRHVLAARLGRPRNRMQAAGRRNAGRMLRALPPRAWDGAARLAARIPLPRLRRLAGQANVGAKVHKLALALEAGDDAYEALTALWPAPEDIVHSALRSDSASEPGAGDLMPNEAERFMLLDAQRYLPDDVLAKVDRCSMAVGLETRAPLLGQDVFATAWRLPLTMRVRHGRGKWALRQVLARYLSPSLFERPKAGFAVPLAQWLRGPLRDWAEALLDENRLRKEGHLHAAPIRQAWKEHQSGEHDWSARLWVILMFQAWLDETARRWPTLASGPGAS